MTVTLIDLCSLAFGIALLIVGGDLLVRGAITIAVRLGISSLIVGLTVVAFGTSAPELSFNLIAALEDQADLSYGNIIGSNIANIGLVLGIAALIQPMRVHTSVIRRELPFMIGVTFLAATLTLFPRPPSTLLGAGPGLQRAEGFILLACFALFSLIAYFAARAERRRMDLPPDAEFVADVEQISEKDRTRHLGRAITLFLLGLGLLVIGGKFAEDGATGLAIAFGVSDTVVGLTIVAIATSLPELFVCVIAALRNQADIAVGNVVGSNIFNLTLVLALTAIATPVPLPAQGLAPLFVMVVLSVLLLIVTKTKGQMLSRLEGAFLLTLYLAHLAATVAIELAVAPTD